MRFAAAKWEFLCCEVALVCQNHFRNCEIPCGMGLLVRNLGFTTSQCVSQLPNEGSCAAKWHSCAKLAFAAAKYPRRDFYSVAEWFCSIVLISQRLSLACEISQSSVFPLFLLYFCSNFFPIFFFQFPWNFFHLGSFKMIKTHLKTWFKIKN